MSNHHLRNTDLSAKLLSIQDGFSMASASPPPSLEPADLVIGIAGALILRLAVCMKGKIAKKYRHGSVCCCSRRRPCPRPPRIGGSKGL